MGSAASPQRGWFFIAPKVALVTVYVGASCSIFVVHGRLPDRISVSDTNGFLELHESGAQETMVVTLCASVLAVGVWLSVLVSRTLYQLGWKKVEYIYTEREKSFVGITFVFVILSLCGHLYRAIHGRRGSWMQLQLPFLTLTNSYLALLAHAFWPSRDSAVAPAERSEGYTHDHDYRDGRSKDLGLLADQE
mmetsp:Transcript_14332/g.37189  ORF Transcript_14332/g.37189 Transcript_14332/m.37189 type:complete len:192 (-) Transcript_14332:203-778(-)